MQLLAQHVLSLHSPSVATQQLMLLTTNCCNTSSAHAAISPRQQAAGVVTTQQPLLCWLLDAYASSRSPGYLSWSWSILGHSNCNDGSIRTHQEPRIPDTASSGSAGALSIPLPFSQLGWVPCVHLGHLDTPQEHACTKAAHPSLTDSIEHRGLREEWGEGENRY